MVSKSPPKACAHLYIYIYAYTHVYTCIYTYIYIHIRHRASARERAWRFLDPCPSSSFPLSPFPLDSLDFLILLRDPHPLSSVALFFVAWILDDVFLYVILNPFFYRFLLQLGSNLAPNLAPKSTKNRSKSRPNSNLTCILFSIAFGIDFGRNFH